jgi:hypothetical protein
VLTDSIRVGFVVGMIPIVLGILGFLKQFPYVITVVSLLLAVVVVAMGKDSIIEARSMVEEFIGSDWKELRREGGSLIHRGKEQLTPAAKKSPGQSPR